MCSFGDGEGFNGLIQGGLKSPLFLKREMKYFFFILGFFFITDKAKYHLAFPLKWYKHG